MKLKIFSSIFCIALSAVIFCINSKPALSDDWEDEEDSGISIEINEHISLSEKTKEEIFDLRKDYVSNSIFASPNYEPSEEVFGQIIDQMPWISTDFCSSAPDWIANIDGPAIHSIYITNPSIPILLDLPYYLSKNDPNDRCSTMTYYLTPLEATYSEEKKEVTVTYPLPHVMHSNAAFQLVGVNARDFGYNYIFLDEDKSTYKIKYMEEDNVSNKVIRLEDFIHLGTACHHESGCNNLSPMKNDLEFQPPEPSSVTKSKVQLYLKLWKEEPSSAYAEPDFTERIIFIKK